jgi:uncharacterized membrane protein
MYGIFDSLWFSYSLPKYVDVVNEIHKRNITEFQLGWYGIIAYITMAITTYVLVVRDTKTLQELLLKAICLAFAMYGVFNFTNATLFGDEWSSKIILIDTSWGIFVISAVSLIVHKIITFF